MAPLPAEFVLYTLEGLAMSDNEFALETFRASGNIGALRAHFASPNFVGDEDAGWEIACILQAPDARPCTCGSGVYWPQCGHADYCG